MKKKSKIDRAIKLSAYIRNNTGLELHRGHLVLAWFRGYEASRRDYAKKLKALKVFEADLEKRSRFSK